MFKLPERLLFKLKLKLIRLDLVVILAIDRRKTSWQRLKSSNQPQMLLVRLTRMQYSTYLLLSRKIFNSKPVHWKRKLKSLEIEPLITKSKSS